jgi:hypothetical protein
MILSEKRIEAAIDYCKDMTAHVEKLKRDMKEQEGVKRSITQANIFRTEHLLLGHKDILLLLGIDCD